MNFNLHCSCNSFELPSGCFTTNIQHWVSNKINRYRILTCGPNVLVCSYNHPSQNHRHLYSQCNYHYTDTEKHRASHNSQQDTFQCSSNQTIPVHTCTCHSWDHTMHCSCSDSSVCNFLRTVWLNKLPCTLDLGIHVDKNKFHSLDHMIQGKCI